MSRNEPAANRSIDLDSVRPVALDGGTAILARTYRTASTGVEIDAGETPIATVGVYSPTDLEHALAGLDFEHDDVRRALRVELTGENATRAVAVAERQAGTAEVLG